MSSTCLVNVNEPVVWDTFGDIKILDIIPEEFEETKTFVIDCLLKESLIYRQYYEFEDIIRKEYDNFYDYILKYRNCLVAKNESTGEIVGVLMGKLMTKEDRSWTSLQFIPGKLAIKIVLRLYVYMIRESQKNKDENSAINSLHVFRISVAEKYKGQHWKPKLLNAACRLASSMRVPAISYHAFSIKDQRRAIRANMSEEFRVYYNQYKDVDGTLPFNVKKKQEWYVILYKRIVDPPISYEQLPPKIEIKTRRR